MAMESLRVAGLALVAVGAFGSVAAGGGGGAVPLGVVLEGPGPMVGGQVFGMTLTAPERAGAVYVAACSLGQEPGIPTPVGVAGMVADGLFWASVGAGAPFSGFAGVLDGTGRAQLGVAVPLDPGLEGLALTFGAVVLDPSGPGGFGALSNSIQRRLRGFRVVPDFGPVDALLEGFSEGFQLGNRGVAFAYVQNGLVLHAVGFGGFQPDTRVRLGSATKWFAGAALLRLLDQGTLELDTPLSAYLPSFTGNKAGITFRQAYSHTSGLPGQAPCLGDEGSTLQACGAAIGAGLLPKPPGAVFQYGGVSMHAAGAAMELAVGQGFEEWFVETIAGDLGAVGFGFDGFGPTQNPRIAGGGKASALDVAQLLLAMLEGGAANGFAHFSTQGVLELFADQTADAAFVPSPLAGSVGYGLGVWVESKDAAGRSLAVSSPGAFGAYPWIDRARGYGAVVLVDRSLADGAAIRAALLPLLEGIAALQ